MRATTGALVVVLAAAVGSGSACRSAAPAERSPLYDNLGAYSHPVTASAEAQRYFDQGLTLSYAFNHAEAIRAFRQAAQIDDRCAMCYWGIAFALGPNINAPITEDAARDAWQAIAGARARSAGASDQERGYVEALARRYAENPAAERAPLDRAYAEAMRDLSQRFPDDLDAATLYAQSLMDTAPWNYWNRDGSPREFTPAVLAALESVLQRNPDHPGAIHLYIHAVEASPDPGRAERYADRLAALVPGAGHLVHMPSHIYLRVGRYRDATVSNEEAIKADEAYFASNPVAGNMTYEMGYKPHNPHFAATSAAMEGRRARALAAADETAAMTHADMMRDPAMGTMLQHFALTPLYMRVRFQMWDEVLAQPVPPADLPFTRAIAHMARGLALAARDRLPEADKEAAALAALRQDPSFATAFVSSVNSAAAVVAIAHEVLQGDLAVKRRQADVAATHFAQAVALEDGLTYMEPPDWPIPARQLQGAALLELGRLREAEAAFNADLVKFPDNGWSLSGLLLALERQNRAQDAAAVRARLADAWANAEVVIDQGRVAARR